MSAGFPSRFLKTPELRERADEILIGEIVAYFVGSGLPLYRIQIDEDSQRLRFRAQDDEVLYAVEVSVRREGRAQADQAQGRRPLAITAEIKNFLARPGDLLKMHEKVPTNLPQPSLPHTPGIKLFRQLNSVFASVQLDYAEGQRSRAALHQLFGDHVTSLREVLLPYSLDRPQTLP